MSGTHHEADQPVFLEEYNKLYEKFANVPIIIEGPEYGLDYSYFLVDKCEDIKNLEKGIPLSEFEQLCTSKDPEMEYRVLTRINCHKIHY